MDIKKRPKNFRDIKQGFLHFRDSHTNNENIPTHNIAQSQAPSFTFKKMHTQRFGPDSFTSPPKPLPLTINTHPIQNIDFSSSKKKGKLLTFRNPQNLQGQGYTDINNSKTSQRNTSTASNRSEGSDKKVLFGRFARLAENSKEKQIRGPISFQRITSTKSQEEATNLYQLPQQSQSVPAQNIQHASQPNRPATPKQLTKRSPQPSFPHHNNHVRSPPAEPRLSCLTPKQKVGEYFLRPSLNVVPAQTPTNTAHVQAPTATPAPSVKLQHLKHFRLPNPVDPTQRKESMQSEFDQVNISMQSVEHELDMSPYF